MALTTGHSARGFRSSGNARLPVAFVVLRAGELPGRDRFLAWSRRSDLDTTETEASRWSRASPEVGRGRSRGADRWRAAWLAFPAGSGGTGPTGEWGRAVRGWDRLHELTGGPAFAPAPELDERRCFCARESSRIRDSRVLSQVPSAPRRFTSTRNGQARLFLALPGPFIRFLSVF